MKQAISPEALSDSSHSCIPEGNESTATSTSRVKSAAMLGIALSVGASGALVSQAEASAAISTPTAAAATKAFSSNSKVSVEAAQTEATQREVVAFHTVESGESLWQIAQQHRIGLQDLKIANELPVEASIRVGQVLKVPGTELIAQADEVVSSDAEVLKGDDSEQLVASSIEFEIEEATEASAETAPSTQPELIAQSVDSDGDSVETFETQAQASIEIEIADASSAIEIASEAPAEAPVVTALATPQPLSSYQIQAGDTLASIASSLGTTTEEIISVNGLSNPNVIFAGATIKVPGATSGQSVATGGELPSGTRVAIGELNSDVERLAYLQSTAVRPDAAGILEDLRSATPEEPVSVGGEEVTEQDIIGTNEATGERANPYTASLLEDVEDIRGEQVEVAEVAPTEIEGARAGATMLARSTREASDTISADEQIAIVDNTATASPELLAAAPLSPEAYIPAQRPSQGQVVSPDMPILPDADEFLPEAPDYFDGYVWPTRGTVTSGYGWRWGRMHRGVDVAGPVGTPIVAAAMGVVEQAGWNSGGYGNLVEIRHPDGSLTRYAHNNSLSVSAGQTVSQGQKIAEMGSTGYSTGPHLHFEVHMSGQGAVNPVAYLPNR